MYVNTEDKPPMLRFENTAEIDKVASEQAGRPVYMDVVKVFIRAPGDKYTEVPAIARKTKWEITETEVTVTKEFTEHREVDGEIQEVVTKQPVKEMKRMYTKHIVTPWLDNLIKRHKDGRISDSYFNHCKESFERFLKNQDMPIDGTPLADWPAVHEKIKKRAIEIGINSIEKAADMTETAIQEMGMGGRDLKKAAVAYLERQKDPDQFANKLIDLESRASEAEQEKQAMAEKMTALEKKLEELSTKKRGRPPKEDTEAA